MDLLMVVIGYKLREIVYSISKNVEGVGHA